MFVAFVSPSGLVVSCYVAKQMNLNLIPLQLSFFSNDWVQSKVNFLVIHRKLFCQLSRDRDLHVFGHVTRLNSLFKTILQSTLESG